MIPTELDQSLLEFRVILLIQGRSVMIQDPDVIRQILEHLGLWDRGVRESLGGGCGKMPVQGPVVYENFDDGWPGYEEPIVQTH